MFNSYRFAKNQFESRPLSLVFWGVVVVLSMFTFLSRVSADASSTSAINQPEFNNTIVIIKQTIGGDGTFDFTSTDLGSGVLGVTQTATTASFQLTTISNTAVVSFTGLLTGTYSVTETIGIGWMLNSASCDNGTDPSAIAVSGVSSVVTCTFVNQEKIAATAGSIGDTIWADLNSSGGDQSRQGLEPGLAGITVTLTSDAGVIITKTTDTSGNYLFDNLPFGTYTLTVDTANLPSGYQTTPTYDPDGSLNNEAIVTISSSEPDNLDQDFSYRPLPPGVNADSCTGVMRYEDYQYSLNNLPLSASAGPDGVLGTSDDGRAERVSTVLFNGTINGDQASFWCIDYSSGIQTGDQLPVANYTDATTLQLNGGKTNLLTGDNLRRVTAILQNFTMANALQPMQTAENSAERAAAIQVAIWTFTNNVTPVLGQRGSMSGDTLADYNMIVSFINAIPVDQLPAEPEQPRLEVIAPAVTNATVGDLVGPYLIDTNALSNTVVLSATFGQIVDASGAPLTGPFSNGDEFYLVSSQEGSGLISADAVMQIVTGTVFSDPILQRMIANTSSNPVYTCDLATASWSQFGSIGDTIWGDRDQDGDNLVNGTDVPLAGVVVSLQNSSGNIMTTTTDANGNYLFPNLPFGTYTVTVDIATIPVGYSTIPTYDPMGTGTNTSVTTIDATNPNDLTQDFSYPPALGNIGDTIWGDLDQDADNLLDGTDVPLQGVVIWLTYPDGTTISDTTDANGHYLFVNLPFDTYTVTVDTTTLPAGYQTTPTYDPQQDGDSSSVTTLTANLPDDLGQDFSYPASNLVWQPAIALTKTAGIAADSAILTVTLPATVTYHYEVANTGNTALIEILITDDAGTASDTSDDKTLSQLDCPALAGPIMPGASVNCDYDIYVITTTTNVATATGIPTNPTDPTNPFDPITGTKVAEPPVSAPDDAVVRPNQSFDLVIVKTANVTTTKAGDTITYTLTVTNNGPTVATGVVVTDTLPLSVTYLSADLSQGTGCTPQANLIVCDLGNLNAGAMATITIVVQLNSTVRSVVTARSAEQSLAGDGYQFNITVFDDLNLNGLQDADEPGVPDTQISFAGNGMRCEGVDGTIGCVDLPLLNWLTDANGQAKLIIDADMVYDVSDGLSMSETMTGTFYQYTTEFSLSIIPPFNAQGVPAYAINTMSSADSTVTSGFLTFPYPPLARATLITQTTDITVAMTILLENTLIVDAPIELPLVTMTNFPSCPDSTQPVGSSSDPNDYLLNVAEVSADGVDGDPTNNLGYVCVMITRPVEADWGDLPDSYSTTNANGGAYHIQTDGALYLGNVVDTEADGLPSADALGDNLGGNNDEEGVQNTSVLIRNQPTAFDVVSSGDGVLGAWIDWDGSGAFDQPNEFYTITVQASSNQLIVTVPSDYTQQTLATRFRLYEPGTIVTAADYEGVAVSGEVEDYLWSIPTSVQLTENETANRMMPVVSTLCFAALLTLCTVVWKKQQQ